MAIKKLVEYRGVKYRIGTGLAGPAFFVLGVRKSGSSILNSIVQALADFNKLNYVDVAGKLFEAGLPVPEWQSDVALAGILAPGNVYGGFRNCPLGFSASPLFQAGRKILMVRDPRDALVSEYFSSAYSHSIPRRGEMREGMLELRETTLQQNVDEYVLKMASSFKQVLSEYAALSDDPTCRVFRYEDVILQKATLIAGICDVFGWSVDPDQTRAILGWADVLPGEERPTEFIRKVTPGDHREKLSPTVIARLGDIFAVEMTRYGYA